MSPNVPPGTLGEGGGGGLGLMSPYPEKGQKRTGGKKKPLAQPRSGPNEVGVITLKHRINGGGARSPNFGFLGPPAPPLKDRN